MVFYKRDYLLIHFRVRLYIALFHSYTTQLVDDLIVCMDITLRSIQKTNDF